MTLKDWKGLKAEFLSLGGDEHLVSSLSSPTLRNEARLKSEIRKLKLKETVVKVSPKPLPTKVMPENYKAQADFKDFLSDYPTTLHPIYIERKQLFLKICSLKVQLNDIPDKSEKQSAKIQWEIWNLFQKLDKCQKILNHWKKNRRLMPTETEENFSSIPKKKLDLKRRNLRSSKSKRLKTINKLKAEMPDVEDPKFQVKHNQLNRKLEELAELDLKIEKLTELINDE